MGCFLVPAHRAMTQNLNITDCEPAEMETLSACKIGKSCNSPDVEMTRGPEHVAKGENREFRSPEDAPQDNFSIGTHLCVPGAQLNPM